MKIQYSLLLAASLLASSASAETLFTYGAGEPGSVLDVGFFNIGNEFTVGASPLLTSSIGAFVTGSDVTNGLLNDPFTANLYSKTGADTGTLLHTVVIPVGTPVDAQGFAYAPLAVTLSANTNYVVSDFRGTQASPGGTTPFGYTGGGGPAGTFGTGTTFVENRYNSNDSNPADFPNVNNPCCEQFLGANLQYTVPEPTSLAVMGLGAVSLFATRRRRA